MIWLAGGLVIVVIVALLLWLLGTPKAPAPTGPYAIGSTLVTIGADERQLSLRAVYPTDQPEGTKVPTIDGRTQEALGKLYGFPVGSSDGPDSNAFLDAPVREGRHPVVVFSHGAFAFAEQSLTLLEELASHGFVVLSVSHAGEAALSIFPDGTTVPIDPRLEDAMRVTSKLEPEVFDRYLAALDRCRAPDFADGLAAARELGRAYVALFAPLELGIDAITTTRLHDLDLVLASLPQLDAEGRLAGHLDTDKVGLIGHSMGGWASLATALTHPVQAVAALDIPLFVRPHITPAPLTVPSLHVWAEASRMPGKRVAYTAGTNGWLRGEALWWEATLEETSHMNLSDLSLMPRLLRYTGLLGPADGTWVLTSLNRIVGAFFRQTLMQQTESPPQGHGIVWATDAVRE